MPFGFIALMNPKTFISKTMSVVASLALAIGGSLIATQPASAVTTLTTAASVSGATEKGGIVTKTAAVWSDSSSGTGAWYYCDSSGTAVTSIPSDCKLTYTNGSSTSPISTSTFTIPNIAYCDTSCTSFGTNSAGKFIRWIETSGGATSASASVGPIVDTVNASLQQIAPGDPAISLQVECALVGGATAAGFTVTVNSSSRNVTSRTANGNSIVFTLASSVASGDAVVLAYSRSTNPALACSNNKVLAASATFSATVGGGGGGGGGGGSNVITLDANGGVLGTTTSLIQAGGGVPVTLPTSGSQAPTKSNCTLAGWARDVARANSGNLITGLFVPVASQTVYASWTCTSGSTSQVTRDVERYVPPTPAFQAPILNSLAPKLTTGFSSNGGKLVLKDVKPTDITSVTLNGKAVAIVASKSGSALKIPAGSAAGDLKFTMADGTVIDVPNAVKITQSQVDPRLVDLNNLPNFKAGSVNVPSTITAAINKNKAIILDSVNAKCVGYATSNTASARATALTRASNVCGVITDINESIDPIIKVVVNKVVAKKSPVKYQTW